MSDFPTSLPSFTNLDGAQTLAANNHAARHNKVHQEVSAIAAKIGIDGSADTSSIDYKLSGVPDGELAASRNYAEDYADALPSSKQLAKTTYLSTNYFELLKTSAAGPSSWLLLVVDVFNTYNTASTMEYARYKINITTNASSVPTTLAASKVFGDTLQTGVLTAVANSNGSISLWGRSATSAYRSTGLTYAYAMQNVGALVGYTHPLTSQVAAPTGTFTLAVV